MAKIKLVVIALMFCGVVGYLIYSGLQETTVYYHTVTELLSGKYNQEARGMRVSGVVVPGTVTRDRDNLAMDFRIADHQSPQSITVHYKGVIPDNFKEGMAVLVEGQFIPGTTSFSASAIMLKCPSKYEKQQKNQGAS